MSIEHSRALRLAESATGKEASELERRLEGSVVLVGVEPSLPGAHLAARVLLTTLRRLPGRLVLDRGTLPGPLVERLREATAAIDLERGLEITDGASVEATVRLRIGATAPRGTVRIVPDGYGAHLAGDASAGIKPSRPANALGTVFAAALGAGEAFKHTVEVLPGRRRLHRRLRYCPLGLSTNLGAAPDLPENLRFDFGLVGVGAVGTGAALILSELDAGGKVLLVDRERYAPENRGTYSLGGEREASEFPWKVDVAAAALEDRYEVIRYRGNVEDLAGRIDAGAVPWPHAILSGLDSIEARHATQRLWPNRLIDAATGDTMLGLHDIRVSGPCLTCFLPLDRRGPTSAERLAEATGLSPERLMRGDDPLTEEDLAGLEEARREPISPHLGKPVCGLAQAVALTALEANGYQPAVSFVSLQAACLGVGRLLADKLGISVPSNFVQYDALIGPQNAVLERRRATDGCYCQTRAGTIARVRETRGEASANQAGK